MKRIFENSDPGDTPPLPDQKEAEYDGREVTLYDPFRIEDDEKKFAVYVENPDSGNINKVKFGSDDMSIKRDQEDNLKSFRARMKCNDYDENEKHKAGYWSCVFWREDLPVSDILDENLEWKKEELVRHSISEMTKHVISERASKEYCESTDVEEMGFTQRASCKAQGYIERSSGGKKKSEKYEMQIPKKRIQQLYEEEIKRLTDEVDGEESTVGEVMDSNDMIMIHPRSPQYDELVRHLRSELGVSTFNPSTYTFYIVNRASYTPQGGHEEVWGGYTGSNLVRGYGMSGDPILDENKVRRLI